MRVKAYVTYFSVRVSARYLFAGSSESMLEEGELRMRWGESKGRSKGLTLLDYFRSVLELYW